MNIGGISGNAPSKNEAERQRNIRGATWATDPDKNPCIDEQKLTLKCLDENNYDKEKCHFHFANYKSCKKFWAYVVQVRRSKGEYPHLPRAQDREKVRQELMNEMVDDYNKKKGRNYVQSS